MQLPAWNEALGLPRPWDQQWSLRAQQILAYETDLLEYGDIFDGSPVIAEKTRAIAEARVGARSSASSRMGGIVRCVRVGYVKERLVAVERRCASGRSSEATRVVVGVNRFTEGEPSPLVTAAGPPSVMAVDAGAEAAQIASAREAWRAATRREGAARALEALRAPPRRGRTSCRRRSPRRTPA